MVSTGWEGCGVGSTLSAPVSSFVGPASSKLSGFSRTNDETTLPAYPREATPTRSRRASCRHISRPIPGRDTYHVAVCVRPIGTSLSTSRVCDG